MLLGDYPALQMGYCFSIWVLVSYMGAILPPLPRRYIADRLCGSQRCHATDVRRHVHSFHFYVSILPPPLILHLFSVLHFPPITCYSTTSRNQRTNSDFFFFAIPCDARTEIGKSPVSKVPPELARHEAAQHKVSREMKRKREAEDLG